MTVMKRLLISFVLALNFAVVAPLAIAEESTEGASCEFENKEILGIPAWYKYLNGQIVSGKCRPMLGNNGEEPTSRINAVLPVGMAVLEGMLTLGGVVAVVMVFVGSFKYVLSQGEPDKSAGARKTVINAMIGLVIIIVATRVVSFIGGRLG